MAEKKVNLEEILEKYRQMFIENSVKHPDYIMDAMKEACRQTLELAAENATTSDVGFYDGEKWNSYDIVNKQSILDTINLIE